MLFDKYCHCEILYLVFFSWLPNWVFTLTAYSYIAIYTADLHGFYFHLIYRVLCNFYVIRHWPEGYRTCNNFLKNFVIALTIQTKLIVTDYAKLDISQILHRIIKLIPQHHLHQPSGHPPLFQYINMEEDPWKHLPSKLTQHWTRGRQTADETILHYETN